MYVIRVIVVLGEELDYWTEKTIARPFLCLSSQQI